jgi:hypothetical protein
VPDLATALACSVGGNIAPGLKRLIEFHTTGRRAAVCALMLGQLAWTAPGNCGAPPVHKTRTQTVEQHPADNRGTENSPLVVRVVPSTQEAADAARTAEERQEKASLDRRLVDFNGDLAFYTKVLAIFAGFQFLALIGQVVFLRLAFRETRRAGDVAREAMIAGERAFVFPLGIRGLWDLDKNTNTYHWRFRPVWKNSGDTPTRNMTMHTECIITTAPLPTGFNFNYSTTQIGKALIPPNTDALGSLAPNMPKAAISPQDILDSQHGTKWLYIWGWARYSDVFANTPQHITRFCWVITPVGNPLAFDPNVPAGIDFQTVHHTEGNCADDECS